MDKAFFVDLYRYNYWAQRKVWDCVVALDEAQFKQELDYSIGSIHSHCVHMMAVETWWFEFLHHGTYDFLDQHDDQEADFPTRELLRIRWDASEKAVFAYLDTLTKDELARIARPDFWHNNLPSITVSEALLQVANHSTDHRAQMLAGLHQLGGATVAQDYLDFAWEKRKK